MPHPWENYVAIGDSFTAGVGDAIEGVEPMGAADRLAAALRRSKPGMRYANLAKPGLTSGEIRARQLEPALLLEPDLVSIIAGANDILGRAWNPERFEAEMRLMFEAFVRIKATLVTATWPKFPTLDTLPEPIGLRLHRHILKGNAIIQHLATDFGAICLDMMPLSTPFDSALWSTDRIHPNSHGYMEITSRMIQRIERHAGVSV